MQFVTTSFRVVSCITSVSLVTAVGSRQLSACWAIYTCTYRSFPSIKLLHGKK